MPQAPAVENVVTEEPKQVFRPIYPEVHPGMNVQYIETSGGRTVKSAAIVLSVGKFNVSLIVWPAMGGGYAVVKKDVHHASDPEVKVHAHIATRGTWDYVPEVPRGNRRVITVQEQEDAATKPAKK